MADVLSRTTIFLSLGWIGSLWSSVTFTVSCTEHPSWWSDADSDRFKTDILNLSQCQKIFLNIRKGYLFDQIRFGYKALPMRKPRKDTGTWIMEIRMKDMYEGSLQCSVSPGQFDQCKKWPLIVDVRGRVWRAAVSSYTSLWTHSDISKHKYMLLLSVSWTNRQPLGERGDVLTKVLGIYFISLLMDLLNSSPCVYALTNIYQTFIAAQHPFASAQDL